LSSPQGSWSWRWLASSSVELKGRVAEPDGCPRFAPAYLGRKRWANPDFLYAAPPMFACAAFYKESRMEFLDSTEPPRKSGGARPLFCNCDAKVRCGCGLLIRNNSSIKPPWVFGTAGSTTKRRVPHPLRSLQRVGYATVGIEIRGIPPFAKCAKDGAPGDLLHFLPRSRNAPFHAPRVDNAGG
jgi:hypothetical protein